MLLWERVIPFESNHYRFQAKGLILLKNAYTPLVGCSVKGWKVSLS